MDWKKIHAEVRKICEGEGFEVTNIYNDKRKDGTRRLSYGSYWSRFPNDETSKRITDKIDIALGRLSVSGYSYVHGGPGYYFPSKFCIELG